MRPNRIHIGTLAYLMCLAHLFAPVSAVAQSGQLRMPRSPDNAAPVVTRAAPIVDQSITRPVASGPANNGAAAESGHMRLTDQAPDTAGLSDRSWTGNPAPPVQASASANAPAMLPPLPGPAAVVQPTTAQSAPAQSAPVRSAPAQSATVQSAAVTTSANLPTGLSNGYQGTAPAPVVQAQYTGSDATPLPLPGRNSKPTSLSTADGSTAERTDSAGSGRPLKPRSQVDATANSSRSGGTFQMIISVISSLMIVIALMLGAAWCYRKAAPKITGTLPKEAVHVLGRTALNPRQQLVLIRFGSKLVLVSNLQGEVRTISEINDPLEVDRIAGACESAQVGSISHSFRTVLHNLGGSGE